jgi:hypothetical protein
LSPGPDRGGSLDALYAELLDAGESPPRLREVLARHAPDETELVAALRRSVPVALLEHLAATDPWSRRPAVLAHVVLNPRAPRALSLRIVSSLFWRDLAEVAATPHVAGTVRVRAEGLLKDLLPELRLGDRVALAKIATPAVLPLLLADADPKVAAAALLNPRLREEDLVVALRRETVPVALLEAVSSSSRWGESYAVRLTLVLQPRTPLPLALLQISSLVKRDLLRVAESPGLKPLVQAAARRVAEERQDS